MKFAKNSGNVKKLVSPKPIKKQKGKQVVYDNCNNIVLNKNGDCDRVAKVRGSSKAKPKNNSKPGPLSVKSEKVPNKVQKQVSNLKPEKSTIKTISTKSKINSEHLWKPKSLSKSIAISTSNQSIEKPIDFSKGEWIDVPRIDDLGRPIIVKGRVPHSY